MFGSHNERKPAKLWNVLKKAKKETTSDNFIEINKFVEYFTKKFKATELNTEVSNNARADIEQKYIQLQNNKEGCNLHKYGLNEYKMRHYIKLLNTNSAPGSDGITPNHLRFASDSKLVLHLSTMFNICLTYGVLPDEFNKGILVPILKKSTLNPTEACNYRPITISVVISKLIEIHTLNVCDGHQFCDAQFGYVGGRNTNMVTALAHDIGAYCVTRGSTTFYCSVDAQGAFDTLPHHIILKKAMGIVPDPLWLLMYQSYADMCVMIRWKNYLSESIPVTRGTKQGSLTSPFYFNLFYQELVELLQKSNCGITIGNNHYNCYCYADDLLLSSLTVTGLQKLIDKARNYVSDHGLQFNPEKTSCIVLGNNPFTTQPTWHMNNTNLKINKCVKYLGTFLGDTNGSCHIDSRIKASTKAFYGLQNAGIKCPEIKPQIVVDIYRTAVNTVLQFGCSTIHINRTNMIKVNRHQCNLIKRHLGLSKWCHSSSLLQAVGILPLSVDINLQTMDLLKKCVITNSLARSFYSGLLCSCDTSNTIVSKCRNFSNSNKINLIQYIFNDSYAYSSKKSFLNKYKCTPGKDGLVDTIGTLLNDYTDENVKVLNLLLKSF